MTVVVEPAWLTEARRHIGTREIKGAKHNGTIIGWLKTLKAWWAEDETPWCGVFVANCMRVAGMPLPKYWMRAKDWLNWGKRLLNPVLGCVVVFEREGGGHVGFVVGRDKAGNLMVLGGNQGDAVNIRAFPVSRVVGYRWPVNMAVLDGKPLPLLVSDGRLSANEA